MHYVYYRCSFANGTRLHMNSIGKRVPMQCQKFGVELGDKTGTYKCKQVKFRAKMVWYLTLFSKVKLYKATAGCKWIIKQTGSMLRNGFEIYLLPVIFTKWKKMFVPMHVKAGVFFLTETDGYCFWNKSRLRHLTLWRHRVRLLRRTGC